MTTNNPGAASALLSGTELTGIAGVSRKTSPAVMPLTVYAALLMFIPSALVLAPLGGAGSPATIVAVVLLGWYLARWLHPACALARQSQPIRTAAIEIGRAHV